MINLTRPQFFTPIHGDFRQLTEHAALARSQGLGSDRIRLIENGDVLRLDGDEARIVDQVSVGRRFIDEGRTGEVHEIVLRDRRYLSEDGFIVVLLRMDRSRGQLIGDPELISRGFVLMDEVVRVSVAIEKNESPEGVVVAAGWHAHEWFRVWRKTNTPVRHAGADARHHRTLEELLERARDEPRRGLLRFETALAIEGVQPSS